MGSFELHVDIARPPAAVWAVLSDVTRTPEWYEAVVRVVPVSPAGRGTGATYSITRTLPGGTAVNLVQVTESVSGERFTMESRSGPTPFTYRYSLTSVEGGTRLTLDGEISAEGLPQPLASLGPVVTTVFKKGMRSNLRVLARSIPR
ncbi:SRPBCC family protein [Mumia sp. DW29H23]|uniref:SRPBCC family protein n=1 Tax=Mumia sp. DW29H23 TaxID=3421241 RepID=UPI003D69D41D